MKAKIRIPLGIGATMLALAGTTVAMAPSASAAGIEAQMRICTHAGERGVFKIRGLNQHWQFVSTGEIFVNTNSCVTVHGWWWKTGSEYVTYVDRIMNGCSATDTFSIPRSFAGGTYGRSYTCLNF